jgi:phenylacetate-coenzyme A ligase PaaK-like adenylate-forming protein
LIPVRRFDATQPLAEIVAGLNDWRPENLICYASMSRVLAEEQLAGRLRIAPRAVMCSSEVLTAEARRRIHLAFGAEPFNVYAATLISNLALRSDYIAFIAILFGLAVITAAGLALSSLGDNRD